jgi:uncharacterized membrane protein YsdA (DUF1294 family)
MRETVFWCMLIYMCFINLISAVITILDKLAARRKAVRVPERTLLLLGALGGAAGMYFTMKTIRHKTKHLKFMLGLPVIFVVQLIIFAFCLNFF